MENTPPTAHTQSQTDPQLETLSEAQLQRYRRILRDLVEIGLEQARTVRDEALARPPGVASVTSAVDDYVRISGAVCRAILLAERLAEPR